MEGNAIEPNWIDELEKELQLTTSDPHASRDYFPDAVETIRKLVLVIRAAEEHRKIELQKQLRFKIGLHGVAEVLKLLSDKDVIDHEGIRVIIDHCEKAARDE